MTSPAFYAIIPANVRYCKELEPNAKLLYGEITALAQKEGYCWATNAYFADLYSVDVSTIKRWLQSLKEKGFIFVEQIKNGLQIQRRIWISEEFKNMFTKAHFCAPPSSKISPPQLKNEPHIITSSTTSKNPPPQVPKEPDQKPTEEEEEELEKRFKERNPNAPRVKSRKAWDAVVLKQIREERSEHAQEVDSSKKRQEMASKHLRQAEKYAFKQWKGFKVTIREDYVEFSSPKGGFTVAYAIPDEKWETETGWTA